MQAFLDILILPYHTRWVRECLHFIVIVGGIFLLGMVLLYRHAFYLEFTHYWGTWTASSEVMWGATWEIFSPVSTLSHQREEIVWLEDLSTIGISQTAQTMYDYNLDSYLSSKLSTYTLAFNTLIPGNRILIPSLWIDVPIVNVNYASDQKLTEADFDEELRSGVVRYPFTALPGEIGNSLVFWHSSVDAREQEENEYGFAFYKLPKILPGEEIHVVREGKRYTYVVEEKVIKDPDEVSGELKQHINEKYLTLMACYPLFTDARRILVRAKYKEDTSHLAGTLGEHFTN